MRKKFLPSSLVTFAQPKQDILSYPNKEFRILDEGILWKDQASFNILYISSANLAGIGNG